MITQVSLKLIGKRKGRIRYEATCSFCEHKIKGECTRSDYNLFRNKICKKCKNLNYAIPNPYFKLNK